MWTLISKMRRLVSQFLQSIFFAALLLCPRRESSAQNRVSLPPWLYQSVTNHCLRLHKITHIVSKIFNIFLGPTLGLIVSNLCPRYYDGPADSSAGSGVSGNYFWTFGKWIQSLTVHSSRCSHLKYSYPGKWPIAFPTFGNGNGCEPVVGVLCTKILKDVGMLQHIMWDAWNASSCVG